MNIEKKSRLIPKFIELKKYEALNLWTTNFNFMSFMSNNIQRLSNTSGKIILFNH
jgi:hypothetical protein